MSARRRSSLTDPEDPDVMKVEVPKRFQISAISQRKSLDKIGNRRNSFPCVNPAFEEDEEMKAAGSYDRFNIKSVLNEDENDEEMTSRHGIPNVESRVSIFSHFINLARPQTHAPVHRNSIDLTIDDCLSGEVLPAIDNYRKSFKQKGKMRLSIDELLNECQAELPKQEEEVEAKGPTGKVVKLSWVEGVLMNCLLNIWGVMLFLRVTWVIGQAGLVEGLIIISISNAVTFLTSLSMSAICTNGQITGGGLYYMISRSLGPEFGGAIGLMLTLANSMGVAMETLGFCESLLDCLIRYIFGFNSILSAGRLNDLRLLGVVSLICLLVLAIGGMDWVTRVQVILLVVLVAAQLDFITGTMIPPSEEQIAKGYVGFSLENFQKNMWPDFSHDSLTGKSHSFFTVFAVFFPACSGIDAGANLSGDLKDPITAIPKGTLMAVGITYASYILTGVLSAGCAIRYASGSIPEYEFSQNILNETMIDDLNITQVYTDCEGRHCSFGLIPSQQMIEVMAGWGPLIYAGCFAATLSSAISMLVGAPRIFQAVAKDKLYPGLDFFGEGYGVNNEPLRAYCLVFVISVTCILIGDLNQVSSILSNFFVASFALINFSVFHASITKAPNWRPTFRFYSPWLSLFATLLCMVVMFLMDWRTAIATYLVIVLLYVIIYYRKPDANWGSSAQSLTFISALRGVQTLAKVEDHVKTYRPKILLLTGDPTERPFLVHMANMITKRLSLLHCVNIVSEEAPFEVKNENIQKTSKWLAEHRIKAFYSVSKSDKLKEGVRFAMELVGLGNLSPNLVMIGFKDKWRQSPQETRDYVSIIQNALELRLSVGILRIQGGLSTPGDPFQDNSPETIENKYFTVTSCDNFNFSIEGPSSQMPVNRIPGAKRKSNLREKILRSQASTMSRDMLMTMTTNGDTLFDEAILQNLSQYRGAKKQKEGTIDVYWLYDTGGLTLLLPFIINSRAMFAKCKLRVFVLANKEMDLKEQAQNLALMLKKFRITFQQIILISDATKRPEKSTREKFQQMVTVPQPDCGVGPPLAESLMFVNEVDLAKHNDRTKFYLRISEIVQANSSNAALIFMTMPLPTKGTVPPSLYMAWLDFMSQNLPPFFYVRGNQESVLTFYS